MITGLIVSGQTTAVGAQCRSNGVRACKHFGDDNQGTGETSSMPSRICVGAATMGLDTPHGGTSIGIYNSWGPYDTC